MAAKYRSRASKGLTFGSQSIVYEHAIPLRLVQDELIKLTEPTPEAVKAILDRMLVICIITKEEDQRLGRRSPADWDYIDQLARYQNLNIELELNQDYAFATKG